MNQPTPDFRITLDGKDLTSALEPRLQSMTVTECRQDEADTLDLTLNDSDGLLAIPSRGALLAVSMGWAGSALIDKGTFKVDEVEAGGAPDYITIRARSASMTQGMGERQEKSWHGQTIGAIVAAIAGKHSLKPTAAAALAKIIIPHIDQTHESDMSFLSRLAKRYDAVMTVKDSRLLFMPIGEARTASGQALSVLAIERHSGDQHRYHVAERENYAGVKAFWHSTSKAKRNSLIVGGETTHNIKVLPEIYPTEYEARIAAQSELKRTQRGQATMDYTLALGRPEIFPELPVTVSGFKPEIDETPWLVRRARHSISDMGLVTNLELEMRDDPTTSRHRSNFRRGGG
jgi:phage protein D